MTNAIATKETYSLFADMESFEGAQRVAKMLAESSIVPQQFQKNVANCVIALELATRVKTSPIMIMQNLYVVYGRPSFSSQYIIGMINASRRFDEPLLFELTGEGDKRSCYCYTTKQGKTIKGPEISIAMAKAEGWYDKNGSKWKTMPELMLQYRAASFFGRLYCPDLIMGLMSREEVEDIADTTQEQYEVYPNAVELDPLAFMVEDGPTINVPEEKQPEPPQEAGEEPIQQAMNLTAALGDIE